jgi:hypothetical protein
MPRRDRFAPPPKTYGRRRCVYCDKWFVKTKPNKKFCSLQHQKAFNSEGMALGPLRNKFPKWITREVTKQLAKLGAELRAELAAMLPEAVAAIVAEATHAPALARAITRRHDAAAQS